MLNGEANTVDLLLVEALRAFFPEVDDIVRMEHAAFSGVESDRRGRGDERPRSVAVLTPVLEAMPAEDADAVKALLIDLFPGLSGAFGHSTHGSDWLARWERERRVSLPDYCPRYFTYAIPTNDVPDAVVTALLDAGTIQDEIAAQAALQANLSGRKAGRLIEKLRNLETTVDPKAAELLALTLAKLGAVLPNPLALFAFAEPPTQAAILISHLLRRIATPDPRVAVAKRVAEVSDPLWFGVECVRWFRTTEKPEKEASNALTADKTTEVRRIIVERIKGLADGLSHVIKGINKLSLSEMPKTVPGPMPLNPPDAKLGVDREGKSYIEGTTYTWADGSKARLKNGQWKVVMIPNTACTPE